MQAILLLGPTAAGKSALAIAMAHLIDAEIVNCDAMQIYQALPILCAQPSKVQLAQAPHHLYGVLHPHMPNDVAQWLGMANDAIRNILARNKRVIVCGGTGMYGRALYEGIVDLPPIDENIMYALDALSTRALYDEYLHADVVHAQRIGSHDRMRLMRAMAVYRQTDKPLGWWQAQPHHKPLHDIDFLKIALIPPRADLHRAANERIGHMVANGVLEEICAFHRNYAPVRTSVNGALGYRQFWQYIDQATNFATACDKTLFATRQYIKRQTSWLRTQYTPDFVATHHQQAIAWLQTLCV